MLLIRTPLCPISGNVKRGCELTPYERGIIIGSYNSSKSPCEIELEISYSRGAVRSTIALETTRANGVSLPRSGHPIIYNDRDKRIMLRYIRIYPKSTFEERHKETGLNMSNSYIKNLVRRHSIHHWHTKKRPELTEKHIATRLLWYRCRAHWDVAK